MRASNCSTGTAEIDAAASAAAEAAARREMMYSKTNGMMSAHQEPERLHASRQDAQASGHSDSVRDAFS